MRSLEGSVRRLVVVHDAVHRLDPVGVEVPVEEDPLGVLDVRHVGELAHVVRKQAVLPLAGRHVDVAVELLGRDRLGVDVADEHLGAVGSSGRRCWSGRRSPC